MFNKRRMKKNYIRFKHEDVEKTTKCKCTLEVHVDNKSKTSEMIQATVGLVLDYSKNEDMQEVENCCNWANGFISAMVEMKLIDEESVEAFMQYTSSILVAKKTGTLKFTTVQKYNDII